LLEQAWVYQVTWRAVYLVPLGAGLLAAAPALFGFRADGGWVWQRGILGSVLLAVALGADTHGWKAAVWRVELSSQVVNLLLMAGVCLWLFVRERRAHLLDGTCVLTALAFLLHGYRDLSSALAQPSFWAVGLCGALYLLWAWFNRASYWRLLAGTAAMLALACLARGKPDIEPAWEFARYLPLCAALLAMLLRKDGPWRAAGLAMAACLGPFSCSQGSAADLAYYCLVASALALEAWRTGRHVWVAVLVVYLVLGHVEYFGLPWPEGTLRWGWLAIVLAFVLFGLAFLVTQRQLAARQARMGAG
jgi:hypothetical protein